MPRQMTTGSAGVTANNCLRHLGRNLIRLAILSMISDTKNLFGQGRGCSSSC